ncbi:Procollagen galactosyltransferase 1-like [Oopsacas minuta]|uniref:Procollagen galactosyltransferase 1-like n=1 Tax=Oopsacas minuta TaxID=111878 RepID=A0AAV7K5E0_9METZ|nr:Procollagen galactosyltransferase 1-like [Oopsacas minuta]
MDYKRVFFAIMRYLLLLLTFNLLLRTYSLSDEQIHRLEAGNHTMQQVNRTILIAVLARNVEHLLPTFFGYLERQDYAKDRISFWIYSDHNIDATGEVLKEWALGASREYHSIQLTVSDEWNITDQTNPWEWTEQRMIHVSTLRQSALDYALSSWADYILFLDTDVFLCNPHTISDLVEARVRGIAPFMTVGFEKLFSNFWGSLSDKGYYKRSENYVDILMRDNIGRFRVPIIHSSVLLDLRDTRTRKLRYWPPPPHFHEFYSRIEDTLIMLVCAAQQGVDLYVTNNRIYGHMIIPIEYYTLKHARDYFLDFSIENLVDYPPIPYSTHIKSAPATSPDTLGVDKIFVINLERRPERRERMKAALKLLNIDYELFSALDGRQLNESYLEELQVNMLPGWRDPWGSRPITYGEIGCFLSHYFIWERVVKEEISTVIVLEDDIRFSSGFRNRFSELMSEVKSLSLDWDLIYLGRKRLVKGEPFVTGSRHLVHPDYTYWTVGYMISIRGAKKLLAQEPLRNIMAVDEYLPIMFDKHPRKDWSQKFHPRDLKVYSVEPLVLEPTHFVGDKYYFTDTEPYQTPES